MNSLRIVFMGTPEFAVSSLQILHENEYEIVGVVTAPDRPKGRGKILGESAVKKYAVDNDLPLLQPVKLKDPEFIQELTKLNANLFIVVAFRMLPEIVWKMPALGTFNLHASLLPKYRGAAPINWAIINGETETGVTTFFLKHEIDTGEIILQETEQINDDDDAGSLYNRLMIKGAKIVLNSVVQIESGSVNPIPQKLIEPCPAPKIFREDCQINWDQSAGMVINFIRGLSPYPGAWAIFEGKVYKFFKASSSHVNLNPGDWSLKDNKMYVGCSDKAICIDIIQSEGKKRMMIGDFLKGNEIGK